MPDPVFYSSLTMEEIEDNFKDIDFFSAMVESLNEAIASKTGERTANLKDENSDPGFLSPK